MDTIDPRKLSLLRKTRRGQESVSKSVAKSGEINLDGLVALQPRKPTLEIHFLPLPEHLAQLLPQEQSPPKAQDTSEYTSEVVSRVAFESFKQEVDAKIDLRNAEMASLRVRLLVMEQEIALIRKSMLRIRTFTIAGSLFVLAWAMSLSLFF